MKASVTVNLTFLILLGSGFIASSQPELPSEEIPASAPASTNVVQSLKKLSVEELLQQRVTSVERRSSTVGASAAAVSVITTDDIRRSGATSIPEVLRRVPGVDVARITGNIWAISIRGFNDRFANKLLVQIDGRTLYNPLFAGVFWDSVDYPLEDIDRIEVVRGPGATVWGANAVNGVINIITKSAKDTPGGLLTVGGGNEELGFGTVRYGATLNPELSYRVFVRGFDRATQFSWERDPFDHWWSTSTGMRFDWTPGKPNEVMFQGSFLDSVAGQSNLRPLPTPPFAFANLEDETAYNGNLLSRWTHHVTSDNSWTLQAYWDHNRRTSDNHYANYRWDTFDLDFNHEFDFWERHKLVYGLEYRYVDIFGGPSERDAGFTQFFVTPHRHLQVPSAFIQDQFALIQDTFFLIAGTKLEHNDFTGVEIQPTGRLLWTPTTNQSVWFSVSRAVRTPSLAEDELRFTGAPVAPGVLPQIRPNPDFESETLIAYELGYRAQATRALSFDTALFHNDYDKLGLGVPFTPTVPPPPIFIPTRILNGSSGQTDGAEVGLTWQALADWRLYGAYSLYRESIHNYVPSTFPPGSTGTTPAHQVFLQSSIDLPNRIELDTIGRWVDKLPGTQPVTPAYFSLDARVAWRPRTDLELAIVGQNLLQSHHMEFGTNPIFRTTLTQIERSIYAKVTWRF